MLRTVFMQRKWCLLFCLCLQIGTKEWYAADGKARRKASQYFEVLGHTCGRWLGAIALVATVLNLVGNGTAQASSKLCLLDTWSVDWTHAGFCSTFASDTFHADLCWLHDA